ncbi:MAG: hypothetical protein GF309_08000 [Candidatus Lokiarchaeota archaeon]|nr:hypothetical protein [Candidatus Lokiarchaeota archaeon]
MSRFSRFKRSAGRFFRRAFHKPRAEISRGSIMLVIALTLIFFAALGLRLAPLINAQPLVRAFDPWFQLRVTEYIADHGYGAFFNWYDDSTWVPYGRNMTKTSYIGVPFTSAFFYMLANSLGISVSVKYVSLVMPALMGALTTIIAFFLGKEISNNTVGLLSSLFMAFMPAFIQRTVAGFYDNECIGVFAIVLGLYFFTRAIRRDSLSSGVMAGLSLAYLRASWGAGNFLLDLFAVYAFVMLLIGRYSKRLLSSYVLTISLGIFLGGLVPRNGFNDLTSFSILLPIGVGFLLVGYEIWLRIGAYRQATAEALAPHMRSIGLGLITSVVSVASYLIYAGGRSLTITPYNTNPLITLGGKFVTAINPFYRLDERIFASVAEHLPSPWSSFYQTIFVLIFFFPLGMYFAFKRGRDEDWLIILYGLASVYFAGSMIRLSLILAPGVAVLSAIAVNRALSPFAKIVTEKTVFERRRFRMSKSLTSEHALAAYAFVGLLLTVNLVLGVQYAINQVQNPEFAASNLDSDTQRTDWQTAMTYVRHTLPEDAIVASWWDYGYWLRGAGGTQTIVDNATFNSTQIAKMGYALMALNLTESLRVFKTWNATHVLVYWGHSVPGLGGDEGKWPWMVRIAEDRLGTSVIDDETYLGDDPSTPDTEESEATLEPFYSSTLFKLLSYGEPKSAQEAQTMGLPQGRVSLDTTDRSYINNQKWTSHMPVNLHGAFEPPHYSSPWGTVKIYEINYDMYYQWLNRSRADWVPDKNPLSDVSMDGALSDAEEDFSKFDVVFGGGYDASVYSAANSTHVYYGIKMNNYTNTEDAIGFQVAPLDKPDQADIRVANYSGQQYYDGYVGYDGEWSADSSGSNSTELAGGEHFTEFLIPLDSGEAQDTTMNPGMNYQLRFLFWNNIRSGEPTFTSEWKTFWTPVDLY